MKFLALVFCVLLLSCETDTVLTEKVRDMSIKSSHFASFSAIALQITLYEEYIEPHAFELNRKTLHPGKIKIKSPFVPDSALHTLFPGNYQLEPNYFGDDTFKIIWWLCQDCERIQYDYAYWNDPDPEYRSTFPDSSWNTTLLLGHENFNFGSTEYTVLLFFHTTMITPEFCGRFSGAPIGIALFKRNSDHYLLENFIAVAGEYGTYSRPDYPEILVAGNKKLLFDFSMRNGGAGSDYTGIKELFIPYKNTFKKVLREDFLECDNTARGTWSTTMRVLDSTQTTYSNLEMITTGIFHGAEFSIDGDYSYIYEDAPEVFLKRAKSAIQDSSSFCFSLRRVYAFKHDEYRLIRSRLDDEPAEASKEPYKYSWTLY